ncbi:aldo/keto reductase [Candidatus Poribacteria bacterium]|nr:aldo/keto reductase [Candidatus Poribacteria bacterium]
MSDRRIDRRGFLKTVGAGVALAGAGSRMRVSAEPTTSALETRPLGSTGFRASVLGIGVAPLGIKNTGAPEFESVVDAALDAGINYVDAAPNYGNAEERLGPVMARRRDGLFLVTKVEEPTKSGAIRQIENSLRQMRTDRIDAVHLHNMGGFDADAVMGPDGALAGIEDARARGLVRFAGISGHMRPNSFLRAIESGRIDLVMPAMNFVDRHTYNFEETVLPAARERHVAVVAMKVLGGAIGMRYHVPTPALLTGEHYKRAIRYALELEGVSSLVIGMKSVDELEAALRVVREAKPLSVDDRQALARDGKRLAAEWGEHFGPVA